MEPVRIALVGCSGWGREHAKRLQASDQFTKVACYDADRKAAEEYAALTGARVHDSYESLLQDASVEAVLLVVPTLLHTEMGTAAARAGKHIFVEKPIDNTVAAAKRFIRICNECGVTLAVGQSQRWRGDIRRMKQAIDSGELGRVVQAEGNFSHAGGMSLTPQHWRWYKANCPGGPLNLLGVHVADNMNFLFGAPKEVTAFHGKGASPAEMDDLWSCIVRYECGVLATISANYNTPHIGHMNVYGVKGNIFCDGRGGFVLCRDGQPPQPLEFTPVDILQAELEDFADSIRNRRKPEASGPEGLLALAVVEAAVRSSYGRRPVSIEEVLATPEG